MERRQEKEKKKKKKAALAFLLAFSSIVTSCTAIGVVFLKKQSLNKTNNDITKVENEKFDAFKNEFNDLLASLEQELISPEELIALKEIKDEIKKIYNPEVDKEIKSENQIIQIMQEINEVLADIFSKYDFEEQEIVAWSPWEGPNNKKNKKEKLKLSQIDLSKFKTTLKKVNKLNIDNFYKDYVEKLRKEKFEEYKAPLWKKYNQINDFYQKLILDKPSDILINADKEIILEFLMSIKTRLNNAPLKDYDFVDNLDAELHQFYISRIELLVFREDYLALLNFIKEKYSSINTEEVNKWVNEQLSYGGLQLKDVYHSGYKNLKNLLLVDKNYDLGNLIPDPIHYEMGEIEDKDSIYAKIQTTILMQNTNAFKIYGYFEKVINELNKLNSNKKDHKTYFQGILYLEKQIILINERIKAGIKMKEHYDHITSGSYIYGEWAVNRAKEVAAKIKKTSTTEDVNKAIEELKNIKEEGEKREKARSQYEQTVKNATSFLESLKDSANKYPEIINELEKVIEECKTFQTPYPTVEMYTTAYEKLISAVGKAADEKANKDKQS
ncbi:Hypothetical protein, predicted lipoprotein [Mycoplasmopsis bovigenitalium 51080]|uniref:Lipoprotein n=1 Tax=Mycoplasmopsis bovigenitalium 51080 TaxID=1188235 RepID=N9TTQ8_9BACT|nr:hypothetical protein [Mycoplasmopsis bovigenitalium]ENY69475.1 Hypothetical protein, predicted lipoprotein [Mycoplasmopsis bovigenitalium 51080]